MDKSVKKSIKLYLDGQQVSGSVNAMFYTPDDLKQLKLKKGKQ